MPMFAGANYYIRRNGDEPQSEVDPAVLKGLTVDKLSSIVSNAALSNSDLHAEALRKADSFSFQVAHPELDRTAGNTKLINHWLSTHGITTPTFPDFEAAYAALTAENLLSIDKAEFARLQDDKQPRTFKGAITGQTYDSLDSMIAMERQAAIGKMPEATAEETALENMPHEQALAVLREGEQQEQRKATVKQNGMNADSWLTLHEEFVDSERNAHLLVMQLKANGVTDATIEDYEVASRQLRASGLLSLNQKALAKQRQEEVHQRAAEAVKQPGSVFDTTTEDEMYNLDLDEVRRRANVVMAR